MLLHKLWSELSGRNRKPRALQEILGEPIPRISIVDVGAMAEGKERYDDLVAAGLAQVTGFEPNPAERARLESREGPYRYLPHFLGKGGPARFHVTRYPGCASLLEPDARAIDLFSTIGCADRGGNFHVQDVQTVETTRLDDVEADLVVDYLKLDIQGAELDVLRHGTAKLADTVVIETEVEFIALYRNQPLFGDVQCFLRERGFVLHKLIDVAGRPFAPFAPPNPYVPISQLLWADAVFVRDFTRLDGYTDEALLKASVILDLVYGSFDLAALLLAEYDRRRGTSLRARYVDALGSRDIGGSCLNIKQQP